MSKRPAINSFIICDDVRREDNGKEIIIGAYNDAVLFNSPLPGVLTKFCVRVKYLPHAAGEVDVAYEVLSPSKQQFMQGGGKITIPNIEMSSMTFAAGPLVFTEEGIYVIRVGVNEKPKRIGEFEVRTPKSSTASENKKT